MKFQIPWGSLWRRHAVVFLSLLAIVAAGAYLRLVRLDLAAFRSDEIEFWKACHQPLTFFAIWTDLASVIGRTSHCPFPLAFTKGVINTFHLPPTDFFVRLPSALWGVAAVFFAYWAGKVVAGRWFGLLVALLIAMNPIHIQTSREAYFYPPLQLGCVMLTWSAVWAFRHRRLRGSFPWSYYALTGVGFALATQSHLSGWWYAGMVAFATLAVTVQRTRVERARWKELVWLFALYAILSVPLLVMPWGVQNLLYDLAHPEAKAATVRVFGVVSEPLGRVVWSSVRSLAFGTSAWRAAAAILMLVLALAGGILWRRRGAAYALVASFAVVGFGLFWIGHATSGLPFGVRYVAFLLVPYTLLLAVGIWEATALSRRLRIGRLALRRIPTLALSVLAVGLLWRPAMLSAQIHGKPKPYRDIVATVDAALPRGSLVLVDRWLEPWNELAVHNSTNVYFTFTVPNEPMDVCREVNWWKTAQDFFAKFPDAGYLEVCNSYWEQGRKWPYLSGQFARHVTIDDPATRELEAVGLNYREYQAVDFYWNTIQDVMDKARAAGRTVPVIFGPGWGYTKLWRQMRGDFRDWRVLERQAVLNVYNLADTATNASVIIRGAAVNGSMTVVASSGGSHVFPQGQVVEWKTDQVPLRPGLNAVSLRDVGDGTRSAALLVSDVKAE